MNNTKHFEKVFIRDFEEIQKIIKLEDDYEILRLSAILRRLFLDGRSLVDIVNKTHRHKLRFVTGRSLPPEKLKEFKVWFKLGGINPDNKMCPIDELSRAEFFSKPMLVIEHNLYTISDIIKFEANIMGGVHAGVANTNEEKKLELQKMLYEGQSKIRLHQKQLLSIGKVILNTLTPLYVKLKNEAHHAT